MTETFSNYVDTATPRAPNGSELVTLTVGQSTYSATVAQIVAVLLGQTNTWTALQTFNGGVAVASLTAVNVNTTNLNATAATIPTLTSSVANIGTLTASTGNISTLGATFLTAGIANITGTFSLSGNQVSFPGGSFMGTLTGATNVTFPLTGTLATTSENTGSVQTALNIALPDIGQTELYGGTDWMGTAQGVVIGAGLTIDVDGSIGDDDTVDLPTQGDMWPRLYVSGLPTISQNQLYGGTGSWGNAAPVSMGSGLGISYNSLGVSSLVITYTPDTELISCWLS